jgi:hypothetical protein
VSKNIEDHVDLYLIGDTVYQAGKRARLLDLAAGDSAWMHVDFEDKPPLAKPPIDTEPACDRSKTLRIKE